MDKKVFHKLQLNEIKQSDDPTLLPCTFIIFDFEKSWNNTIINKDVALEAAPTLINKPIVCKYHSVEEPNTLTDAMGSHECYIGTDKYGQTQVLTDTIPIGVFTTEGYILTITENGEEKEVLACDAVLWRSRYNDACDLLIEWHNRGININTSCELLYSNYSFQDGIEYIHSPIYFDGHAILNSEERNGHGIVYPAYDSSKLLSFNELSQFQKLVAQAIQKDKEGETMEKFQKVFELSHSDIRSLLYTEMSSKLSEEEYYNSWICDVYDASFVYQTWLEESGCKYFKVDYVKGENTVTVNFDSKEEVIEKREWIKVAEVQTLQAQLEKANTKIEELTTQFNETNEKLQTVTTEKETVIAQFNDATEKVTTLNAQVEELKPFKENFETEQYEKALIEKQEYYSVKFEAVNAKEKFESEEIQNLIKLSIEDSEEGKNAVFSISQMLVDLVQVKSEPEKKPIKEFSSKLENLVDVSGGDFDKRYSE